MELSLVLPCFNEEENIERTIRDVVSWFLADGVEGEIIVVNDGSTDGTADILDQLEQEIPFLRIVTHQQNKGYGATLRDGCDTAQKQYIGFMDSDGQFHAEELAALIPHLSVYRLVAGVRKKRADPWNRRLNAWLYGLLMRSILGVKKTDVNCALVLFERSLWQTIRPIHGTGALYCGEMYFRLRKAGIPFFQVPVDHYPRTAGAPTGSNPGVILRMFRELVQLRRSL
ncbi:glycosyltransferase family 2 protein [Candidatus Peregrinibacteria bacterium CG10_big_fil_rev_8_21_14_0_10_49_10]|nr:MAG: glycosyltransferase family 2 protein [Candidatus Peregrinibacteria bacterium CG10_big_fil_rev_8_21_14_0_10_49_10]